MHQNSVHMYTRFAHLQHKRPFQSPFWDNKVHLFAQIPVVQSVLNRGCASLLVVGVNAQGVRYIRGTFTVPCANPRMFRPYVAAPVRRS